MGGGACQQLYLLHFNRRETARKSVADHPLPTASDGTCTCPPPRYSRLVPALCHRVATRSWLTAEEVYGDAAQCSYRARCNDSCRNAYKNTHAYFTSILKGVSELPQTI